MWWMWKKNENYTAFIVQVNLSRSIEIEKNGEKKEAILWSEELIRFAIELREELVVVVECTPIKKCAQSASQKQ